MHHHIVCLPTHQKGAHDQHEPDQHRRKGTTIHNVLFGDLYLLRHDEQQHNADDKKQDAADQVYGVLDILHLELCAPFIQLCLSMFYQIFHQFQLLFEV